MDIANSFHSEKKQLDKELSKFALVKLPIDLSSLSKSDKLLLKKLIEASKFCDEIYRQQIYVRNQEILSKLEHQSLTSYEKKCEYEMFQFYQSPWDYKQHSFVNKEDFPFVPEKKPIRANFYPPDMEKEEFQAYVAQLSEEDRKEALGFFSVIRRNLKGELVTIPYSKEYAQWIVPMRKSLLEAAELAQEASLKEFLVKLAKGLNTDNYFESDKAWLKLDSDIDVTFGPYETYEDQLFGYKACFESVIGLQDKKATEQLNYFRNALDEFEAMLPMEERFKRTHSDHLSPMSVINVLFTAGDANKGVKAAAFNLPNDEKVTLAFGNKQVLLKNVQEAKFHAVLAPIASEALLLKGQEQVSFEAFFLKILAHEVAHCLGPKTVYGSKDLAVRQGLQEHYLPIEECKADTVGLYILQKLIDKGVLDKGLEKTLYPTCLAGIFRTVRFGYQESHAVSILMQFNHHLESGAIAFDAKEEKFFIKSLETFKKSIEELAHKVLTVEANGDYKKAQEMIQAIQVHPEIKKIVDTRLDHIPTDIRYDFSDIDHL